MLYSTIVGSGLQKTYTTHWGGPCANTAPYTYSVVAPTGVQKSYEPVEIVLSPDSPKDTESFKKIRRSGRIKMTELSKGNYLINNFLGTVPRYQTLLSAPHCAQWEWWEKVELIQPYWEQGDILYWTQRSATDTGMGNARDSVVDSDVAAAIASLQSQVVADNVNTYDLLTELSEGKETLSLLLGAVKAARRPLEAFAKFRTSLLKNGKLSPKEVKKALEAKWMEYRYAIMPCIYSVKDIMELLEKQGDVYKTSRAKRVLTYDNKWNWDGHFTAGKPIWLYRTTNGTVTVSAVGKAWYDVGALKLRLFDQVGINPFVTAWELIPFSFVVDWFVNVGDWVLAQTSQVVDFSTQRVFCYSVKQDFVVDTLLTYEMKTWADKKYASPGPNLHWETFDTGTHLLQRKVVKTYHRKLFVPSDVTLNLDPFLNWKRSLDSWVLLQKPLVNALRRLK